MENSFDIPVARLVAEAQKLPESDRIAFLQLELQRFDDKHNRSIAETYVINQLNQLSRNIIVFIHGINTRAAWQEKFRTLLSQDQNIKVIPIKYGWFNPLWFWFPFFTRLGPIDRVLGQLRNIQKNHRNDNISIVSHSFGTYIVGSILKKNPDIVTHRLILSGCVLPESFAWDFLPTKPVLIINDVGGRDRWPIFAKSFSWAMDPVVHMALDITW